MQGKGGCLVMEIGKEKGLIGVRECKLCNLNVTSSDIMLPGIDYGVTPHEKGFLLLYIIFIFFAFLQQRMFPSVH